MNEVRQESPPVALTHPQDPRRFCHPHFPSSTWFNTCTLLCSLWLNVSPFIDLHFH